MEQHPTIMHKIYNALMRDLEELFEALSRSAFRAKFHLQDKDLVYLHTKGLPTVIVHAGDFIAKRSHLRCLEMMANKLLFGDTRFCGAACNRLLLRSCLEKMASDTEGARPYSGRGTYVIKVLERWLIMK